MIDRSEVNRALAKAIAFKQCGKQAEAEQWAERLVELLECEGILYRTATQTTILATGQQVDLLSVHPAEDGGFGELGCMDTMLMIRCASRTGAEAPQQRTGEAHLINAALTSWGAR